MKHREVVRGGQITSPVMTLSRQDQRRLSRKHPRRGFLSMGSGGIFRVQALKKNIKKRFWLYQTRPPFKPVAVLVTILICRGASRIGDPAIWLRLLHKPFIFIFAPAPCESGVRSAGYPDDVSPDFVPLAGLEGQLALGEWVGKSE